MRTKKPARVAGRFDRLAGSVALIELVASSEGITHGLMGTAAGNGHENSGESGQSGGDCSGENDLHEWRAMEQRLSCACP